MNAERAGKPSIARRPGTNTIRRERQWGSGWVTTSTKPSSHRGRQTRVEGTAP